VEVSLQDPDQPGALHKALFALWRSPFKTGRDLHKLEDSLVEGTALIDGII